MKNKTSHILGKNYSSINFTRTDEGQTVAILFIFPKP